MGLGGGLIYIPSLAVQSHRWRKRRSMAMGIVFSGKSINFSASRCFHSEWFGFLQALLLEALSFR